MKQRLRKLKTERGTAGKLSKSTIWLYQHKIRDIQNRAENACLIGRETDAEIIQCQASIENESKAAGAKETEATQKQAEGSIVAATQVDVKEEPVEEYDGSYECLTCGDSVRGMEALKCSHWQCQSNPIHRACITNPKWLHECPSCKRQTMKPWSGAGGRHAAAVATIDLTTGGGKGRSNAQDPQGAASEPMRERGQGGETGARQKRVARASSAAAMVASGDVTDTGKGGGARGRLVAPACKKIGKVNTGCHRGRADNSP